jgi:hypothetical protein
MSKSTETEREARKRFLLALRNLRRLRREEQRAENELWLADQAYREAKHV